MEHKISLRLNSKISGSKFKKSINGCIGQVKQEIAKTSVH